MLNFFVKTDAPENIYSHIQLKPYQWDSPGSKYLGVVSVYHVKDESMTSTLCSTKCMHACYLRS